jgi:hypothetical protein
MSEPRVPVFFYGSYMNPRVLAEADVVPERFETARLDGFDIEIRPLANLVPAPDRCVFGLLTRARHAELERLYVHAREVLGGRYLPHPVVVRTRSSGARPALCYIAPSLPARPAANDYVERILAPAREYGFPARYLERLESFLARARGTDRGMAHSGAC